MNEVFTCYSLRLATYLIKKGHKLIRSDINVKFPMYYVYFFEKTPELEKDFDVWLGLPNQFKN